MYKSNATTTYFVINYYLLFCSRLWDIECGACLRVLEGHEELVRCIRFDSKRIVSGAYDGKIKGKFIKKYFVSTLVDSLCLCVYIHF